MQGLQEIVHLTETVNLFMSRVVRFPNVALLLPLQINS